MRAKPAGFAKGSPFERLPPAGGRCRRQATKRGTSCRRRRLRGFVSRTIYLHRGFGRSIKYTGRTRTPPVTARSVLSRSQRACPMRKKIGWRGFASRVKSFFRFLFSRKKERELPFSENAYCRSVKSFSSSLSAKAAPAKPEVSSCASCLPSFLAWARTVTW